MANVNNGGPAFPIVGQLEDVHGIGITMRQYAAIKLKVPNSGTDWLDEMIRESLRVELAAKAMEALLSRLPRSITPQECIVVAEDAYFMADAMLKAREMK